MSWWRKGHPRPSPRSPPPTPASTCATCWGGARTAAETRVHLVGASGSGTTTLGRALAERLGCPFFDTDDYFWLPSDPPFQEKRPGPDRLALLDAALAGPRGWVLSGSLCGWGDVFIPLFDLVVFLWLPSEVRLARLREREQRRYGDEALAPGGRLRAEHTAFLAWAAAYDDGDLEIRSRRLHEQWLAALPCPVLRLMEAQPVEAQLEQVVRRLARA